MFKRTKMGLWLFLVLLPFGLIGCATNAHVNQMVVRDMANQRPNNPAFVRGITVGEVSGGHETNPLWTAQINDENFKQALVESLQAANLYHQYNNARYVLNAQLINIHKPIIGMNMTVTAEIKYVLQNLNTKAIVFSKDIVSSYTARFGDSVLGVTRLRMAEEGAARVNIRKLIANLYQLPAK